MRSIVILDHRIQSDKGFDLPVRWEPEPITVVTRSASRRPTFWDWEMAKEGEADAAEHRESLVTRYSMRSSARAIFGVAGCEFENPVLEQFLAFDFLVPRELGTYVFVIETVNILGDTGEVLFL